MSDVGSRVPEPLPDLLDVERPDRSAGMRVALLSAALLCFVLGVILWLTPVLTGVPFYLLGAVLLGMASKRAARWINLRERRLPHKLRLALRRVRRRRNG